MYLPNVQYRITQEQKDKWIGALRSENYRQGKYCLNYQDTYCCLGVLAELNPEIFEKTKNACGNGFTYNESDGNLRTKDCTEYVVLSGLEQSQLMSLNDARGWDFNEIADWIEDNIDVDTPEESDQ